MPCCLKSIAHNHLYVKYCISLFITPLISSHNQSRTIFYITIASYHPIPGQCHKFPEQIQGTSILIDWFICPHSLPLIHHYDDTRLIFLKHNLIYVPIHLFLALKQQSFVLVNLYSILSLHLGQSAHLYHYTQLEWLSLFTLSTENQYPYFSSQFRASLIPIKNFSLYLLSHFPHQTFGNHSA